MLHGNGQAAKRTDLHARFQIILPRIELHARIYFRHLPVGPNRDDAIAETVGLAWRWYVRLIERGKDPHLFPSALATYAARAVKSGRRVCGQERAKDALSPLAQQRHGFAVGKLPDHEMLSENPLCDALADNTFSPVPEQVAFRLDFPAWLETYDDRNRQVIHDLLRGERTLEVARRHSLSPGRISQMRRLFHQNWIQFHGEPADAGV